MFDASVKKTVIPEIQVKAKTKPTKPSNVLPLLRCIFPCLLLCSSLLCNCSEMCCSRPGNGISHIVNWSMDEYVNAWNVAEYNKFVTLFKYSILLFAKNLNLQCTVGQILSFQYIFYFRFEFNFGQNWVFEVKERVQKYTREQNWSQ